MIRTILYFLATIFILLVKMSNSFAQHADEENPKAFEYEFSYAGDLVYNAFGGLRQGGTYMGLAHLIIGFDTEKAGFWNGGKLIIHASNSHGKEASSYLTGDFQVFSNIEAGDLSYIHELKYMQKIGKLDLIIGLQDLNARFASNEKGNLFINSSFGVPSTLPANAPMPIFPLTRPGIVLNINAFSNLRFKLAIFEGLRNDYTNNKYNFNWDLKTPQGSLFVGEIEFFTDKNRKNEHRFKLGYCNRFNMVDTLSDQGLKKSKTGFYAIANQQVYKSTGSKKSIDIFTQIGLTNRKLNDNYLYLGFGINALNLFFNQKENEIGIAVAHCQFADKTGKNETAIELSFKLLFSDNFYLQPDIQFIINPLGTETILKNTLVGTMRFGINF